MKTFKVGFWSVLALTLVLQANGAPGDLDRSFKPGSNLNGLPLAVAVQPDGKIIIGGDFTTVPGLMRKYIARLNPDGTGDPTFDAGSGVTPYNPLAGVIRSIVVQPDGRILIGGWFKAVRGVSRNCIARLNADGTLDTSFDPGVGANDAVFDLALQPDGKVVIAGYFTAVNNVSRNFVARLNSDGSLDSGFDPGSAANYPAYSLALQSDNRIIVGGWFNYFSGGTNGNVIRLNGDGTLDASFSPSAGANSLVNRVVLQPDGKLLIAGVFNIDRLSSNGTPDLSFNGPQVDDSVDQLALQSDGKILIGGQFYSLNGIEHRVMARLNPDGSIDNTFIPALDGLTRQIDAVVLQPDGRILTSSTTFVRLEANGSLDRTFDVYRGIDGYGCFSVVPQPDGRLLIGGNFSAVQRQRRQGIARLLIDGRLDPTFDAGAIGLPQYYASPNGVIYSIALQPDGKVLIGGAFNSINGTARNNIARLNSDGTLDPGFDPGSGTDEAVYGVVLQNDGKALIVGGFQNYNGINRNYIARLESNGDLDQDFEADVGFHEGVTLQPDGKILLGGYQSVLRLNPDGSTDPSFQNVSLSGSGYVSVTAFALQPGGRILVCGEFTAINGLARTNLARLNPDGSVDPSFDAGDRAAVPFGDLGLQSLSLQPDGKILTSQALTDTNGIISERTVRLNPDGSPDATFNKGRLEGSSGAMVLLPDSRIILAGVLFSSFNGVPLSIARLVGDSPVIVKQPQSTVRKVGRAASFTVLADGLPSLRYQWFKDAKPLSDNPHISGTTCATLTLHHVQFKDNGSYTVQVSNGAGQVLSTSAQLFVIRPRSGRH